MAIFILNRHKDMTFILNIKICEQINAICMHKKAPKLLSRGRGSSVRVWPERKGKLLDDLGGCSDGQHHLNVFSYESVTKPLTSMIPQIF